MPAPFPIDPALTAIAVGYHNQSYIADAVLPRLNPRDKETFKYWSYPVEESFIIPDTKVGRRGAPNEVTLTATETSSVTEDYALDDPIPQADISNAPAGHSPVDRAAMQLADYLELDREKRVADLVFAAGAYGSGYKTQLSGTSQWSDFTNSNPVDAIQTGMDAALMRPNVMVLGQAVWTKLRTHPKIVQAVTGQAVTGGIVSREAVAGLFELEEILVGQSFLNTAKKGQTASLSRVWGKHALLFYRNRLADTQGGVTFGFTYQFLGRQAGSRPDPDIGPRGGVRARVVDSVKELIVAPMAAYFIQDAVA
jgi:hypothetical protein